MLKDRGIRRGIEVFVKDVVNPDIPDRKARIFNVPSKCQLIEGMLNKQYVIILL